MAASTAPMSIQERIKAMNMVIADDVVDDATKNEHWSSPSSSPSTPYTAAGAAAASSSSSSNSSPAGFPAAGAASDGSAKRSSVIEIWKKREVAINKSLVTNKNNSMKTPPSQKLDFDEKFEEKKEETVVANKGFAQTVTPERSNGPAPTPVPAPRRSNVRDSWKKKAVTLQQQSSIGPASKVSNHDSGGGDTAGDQRPVVVQTKPFVSQVQPTEERKYNTTTHKITPEKTSNSPKGCGSKLSSSQKGTTSTGAFDELKSKWAKFGVQNLDSEGKNSDGQQMPTPHSPSAAAADTAVTPSLKETHSSSASQNSSDQETSSPPTSSTTGRVRSTMVQQTPLAGGFLKRRTELPPQSDGSPAGFSPVILPPNKNNTTKHQNHFVKLGQKHTSRAKNDEAENPTKQQVWVEGGVGGETSTTKPTTTTSPRKNASSIVIGGATKKALMARRMRSKQRAAMDSAANNKKTTDSPNASPTPTQENFVVGGSGPSSADPKQTISGGPKGDNSTRTYDRVEPPESPFSTAFERDFTLSISNSDSEDQPVPAAKTSTSEPEPCFDDWPGFPDDEGPSPIATKSSENSVQKSASTISPEPSSEKYVQLAPSALASRASRRLHENRQNGVEVAQHERKGDDVAEHQSEDSGQSKPVRDSEDISARYLEMEQEPKEIQPPSPKPMYAPTQFDNTGHSDEVFSDGDNDENSTIASDAGSSVMQSTFASGMTSEATGFTEPKRKRRGRYSLVDVVSNPDDVVPDKFVAEKNASVASFAHAYEKMTFSQLAFDIGEEASSALDMEFWSKGMQSAGDTINKIVGNDLFPTATTTTKPKQPPLSTVNSGEEVAVEVEFIADSD